MADKKKADQKASSKTRLANHTSTGSQRPSKIARILAHLLTGASLNRFEAEDLGDHCLPSTVAVLANTHSLLIQRQPEQVPNRWGKPCRVIRYGLPPSEMAMAAQVLARLVP